jgi:CreA protein
MKFVSTLVLICCLAAPAMADQTIGSVSTNFRLIGPNDKVVIQRLDDPEIPNVHCYASFAQTGGVSGGLGVATDPSEFNLSCVATGPVTIPPNLPEKESVAAISASFLFKHFILTRMVDTDNHTLVYLLISTKVLSGSPANAVSAVVATPPNPTSTAP